MKLTFNGAAHEVTGSCHCLEACNKKIIVDCGMEQGRDIYVNEELPFPISQIDYVFLTHAHIVTLECCRIFINMVFVEVFLQQRQRRSYVESC